jgi:diguanylate cyclase (GGDEF)-like protein
VLEQAQRAEQPSACLMLDIDYFKSINDRYGHVVGDEVLAGVAACIKKTVRHSDIAVRFGGEEFCIIAPGADSETGATLAERIREVVENQCVEADSLPIKVTISIGVASLPAFAPIRRTMLDDLLGYADQALYDAKAMGRNRVVIAETGLE